jgi:catechol 2,3-dioxygenase-like lactoylglutathione lyase family enzyme
VIDHVVLNVSDLGLSRRFYEQALRPLGVVILAEHEGYLGVGEQREIEDPVSRTSKLTPVVYFWLAERAAVTSNLHIAFTSRDRPTVDAFYEAALAAGGVDNGPPGVREVYHPHYYGAFVFDPDGNNIEAVCHEPVTAGDD